MSFLPYLQSFAIAMPEQALPLHRDASREEQMNRDRNQDRSPLHQERVKHADEWQRDLNPNHLAGQNIGVASAEMSQGEGDSARTAFHLRKAGVEFGGIEDSELKQVPVLANGSRLQQGATYVDLASPRRVEFTATGNMSAEAEHAYVPKDRVPYEIWNRLIGDEKPGQKRSSPQHQPDVRS
jgi:hypothetical protein